MSIKLIVVKANLIYFCQIAINFRICSGVALKGAERKVIR